MGARIAGAAPRVLWHLAELARRLISVVLCALVGHAVLYRSVWPGDAAHGYLGWYSLVVGALSIAALVFFPLALATSALDEADRPRWVGALLPQRRPGRAAWEIARLAVLAAGFLVVQESLEHTFEAGAALPFATLGPSAWLLLVVVVTLSAAAIVFVERGVAALVEGSAAVGEPVPAQEPSWAATVARIGRRRPLALHAGLRAPPLLR